MKKYPINSLNDLDQAFYSIRDELRVHGSITVTITDAKANRSIEQNSLMWKWFTEIGKENGHSKDELADIYKEKYLTSIFIRDDPAYAAMVESVKAVKREQPEHYKPLREKILALTSTTQCSVEQMAEYLNAIHRHATVDLKIRLTEPALRGLV